MSRIYFALSLIAVALLIANIVVGFLTGDVRGELQKVIAARDAFNEARQDGDEQAEQTAAKKSRQAAQRFAPFRKWLTFHILFGVLATLVAVLVNSVSVTYFIGTARWCREVVETYRLDVSLIRRSEAVKRGAMPWSVGGILAIIAIILLGGLSLQARTAGDVPWTTLHYMCALVGTALIAWSFVVQVGKIATNYKLIEEIVALVERIRAERGLDANDADKE